MPISVMTRKISLVHVKIVCAHISLPCACADVMLAVVQEKSPDYDSYCMLAEAYMALQEPDKAAAAYEVRITLCKPWCHPHKLLEIAANNGCTVPAQCAYSGLVVCTHAVCSGNTPEGLQPGSAGSQCLCSST